jgi:DNA-binding NarL/FixJ family response regulator
MGAPLTSPTVPAPCGPGLQPCEGTGAIMSWTVLIVDDSAPIRRLVRSFIEQNTDWQVCGEAENGQIAIEKVREIHPDVVILDFQMPVMNGLEAARQIALIAPHTAMLMLTMHCSEQLQKDAQAVGIKSVLSKSDSDVPNRLLASLRSASIPV